MKNPIMLLTDLGSLYIIYPDGSAEYYRSGWIKSLFKYSSIDESIKSLIHIHGFDLIGEIK